MQLEAIFHMHTRCVPASFTLGDIDVMMFTRVVDWHKAGLGNSQPSDISGQIIVLCNPLIVQ